MRKLKKFSNVEVEDLLNYLSEGRTKEEIAKTLGRSWWSLKKKIQRLNKSDKRFYEVSKKRLYEDTGIFKRESDHTPIKEEKELKIYGDRFITGDWHIDLHCKDLFKKLCDEQRAKKKKGEKCGLTIVGDFLNCEAYSKYPKSSNISSAKNEFETAENVLETLLTIFDNIEICPGNHDYRLLRALQEKDSQGELPFQKVARMFLPEVHKGRIRIGSYFWMILNDKWRLTHPKNYSVNATIVSKTLATKFHTNICSTHQHHLGLAKDISGMFTAIDVPTMVDPMACEYVYTVDSKSPCFNQGFICIQDSKKIIEMYDYNSGYKIFVK